MTDNGGNGKDEHGDPYGGCTPDVLDVSRISCKLMVVEKDLAALIAHCRECRTDSREHDGLMATELVHISKTQVELAQGQAGISREQARLADDQRAMLSRLDEVALNVEMIAAHLKGKAP